MNGITWEQLSIGQKAALQRVSKGLDAIGYYPFLLNAGLIATENNEELGFETGVMLTDLGRTVLAQADIPQPETVGEAFLDTVEADVNRAIADGTAVELTDEMFEDAQPADASGAVSDGVALARAQIARLQSALETIRDYPTVEADMDLGHQVAGMAMQAEVALDEVPANSGLLTILADKLTTVQAELATAKAEAARLRAALEEVDKVASNYSGAEMPYINDLGDVFQAGCAFEELAQALASIHEQATEALQAAALNAGEG